MKTTATISQEELEQKAVDSMIAYEKSLISGQEMKDAVTRALHHYANREGHREIVLKGWIIKTIYALDSSQLKDLDRVAFTCMDKQPVNPMIINSHKKQNHENRNQQHENRET